MQKVLQIEYSWVFLADGLEEVLREIIWVTTHCGTDRSTAITDCLGEVVLIMNAIRTTLEMFEHLHETFLS